MRLLLLGIALMAISTPAMAQQRITQSGHVACLTEEWLDDIVTFSVAKDLDSIQAYLDSQKCIPLKGGLKVTVVDAGFVIHQIAYKGVKLWVNREAVR